MQYIFLLSIFFIGNIFIPNFASCQTLDTYIQKGIKNCCEINDQSIDIELLEKEVIYQVKDLYFTLYEKQVIQEILLNNKHILDAYEGMASFAMSNNLLLLNDVLDIGIEKNELHSKSFRSYNEIAALSKNFNRLIGQDFDMTLNIPTKLSVLDILIGNPQIVDNHPLLRKPNDNIVLFDNNDIFANMTNEIKVLIVKNQKIQLESALEMAKLDYHNAVVEVLSAQKNGNETKRVADLILKSFETDPLKYNSLLKLQLKTIKYQLMEIKAIKKAYIAKSKIEFLSN